MYTKDAGRDIFRLLVATQVLVLFFPKQVIERFGLFRRRPAPLAARWKRLALDLFRRLLVIGGGRLPVGELGLLLEPAAGATA